MKRMKNSAAAVILVSCFLAQPCSAEESKGFDGSFLFSPAEIAAIRQAMAGTVSGTAMLEADKNPQVAIPQRRVIALTGVVFRAQDDWVAWINGQKITPDTLLPEIVDIRVERDHVKLKWFDVGLNAVISISLRPHQTYDIVTGVLLPG